MNIRDNLRSALMTMPWLARLRIRQVWAFERLKYLPRWVHNGTKGNDLIRQLIDSESPGAVGRISGMELLAVLHFSSLRRPLHRLTFTELSKNLHRNAGIFPPTREVFRLVADQLVRDLSNLDLITALLSKGEASVIKNFTKKGKSIRLHAENPYLFQRPWSSSLHRKRVLIVTPFASTVLRQASKREKIWAKYPEVLPEFDVLTLKVPLADGLTKSPYSDWFSALESFKRIMEQCEFDVAIIGAGAWGLPLAVHAKALGKIGLHIGGVTQILFGIRGRRWDANPAVAQFYTDAWCRPDPEDTPPRAIEVEDGCYW